MRSSLALPLLLLACAAAAKEVHTFPPSDELFPRLLAAPKEVKLGVSRYEVYSRRYADLSLGHGWGLLQGRAGDQLTQWQVDAQAMSFSRWSGSSLEAVDLVAGLPATLRRGDFSALAGLYHENSHLGDDHIRRTGRPAARTNWTGLKALGALEPWTFLRAYGGLSFALDTNPSPKRWGLQTGVEAMSEDLRLSRDVPVRLYAAEDAQFPERVGFNPNSHFVAGAKLGWKDSRKSMRVQAGYFSGHSYYGQFFADREHFADLSVVLEL